MDTSRDVEDAAGPVAPTRRPRLKLNSDLLLSERGFRYLRSHFNEVQFKGPGYEAEDLDQLMMFYREWAHYLYPQARFSDFVAKTRKECSSKIMKQYLEDLRRENLGGEPAAERAGQAGLDSEWKDFDEVDAGLDEVNNILNQSSKQDASAISETEDHRDEIDDDLAGLSEEERLFDELNEFKDMEF